MNDEYLDIFERIDDILCELDLIHPCPKDSPTRGSIPSFEKGRRLQEDKLYNLINTSKNRVDLFFDAMQGINTKRNKNILIYLRALKYLNKPEFGDLREEIEQSVQ
jgi:hypothetical protein